MGAALDFFNVLHEPSAVFARVKERPRVLVPWLIISVLLIGVGYLGRPFQAVAMESLRASLPPEQAARMGAASGPSILRIAISAPLIAIVALALGAGMLWVGVSLTGGAARYKTLMSVLAYSYVTYIIFSAVTTVVLMVKGIGAVTSFEDLRAPLGLDLLVPGAGLFLGTILNGINPFSIWGVWLCATGISITQGTSRASATVVTVCTFAVALVLQAAPLLLFGMATRR